MKLTIYLIAIVLLAGVWFGINIAKDKPLLSNPLAEADMQEKAVGAARELLEKSGDTLREHME